MGKRHPHNFDNANQILEDMSFVSTQLKGRLRPQREYRMEKVLMKEAVFPKSFFDTYTLEIRSEIPFDKLPWPLNRVVNEESNGADTIPDSNPEMVIIELNLGIEYNFQNQLSVEQSVYEESSSLVSNFNGHCFWSSGRTDKVETREFESTEFTNFEEGLKGILLSTDNPELYAPIIDCLDSRDKAE